MGEGKRLNKKIRSPLLFHIVNVKNVCNFRRDSCLNLTNFCWDFANNPEIENINSAKFYAENLKKVAEQTRQ